MSLWVPDSALLFMQRLAANPVLQSLKIGSRFKVHWSRLLFRATSMDFAAQIEQQSKSRDNNIRKMKMDVARLSLSKIKFTKQYLTRLRLRLLTHRKTFKTAFLFVGCEKNLLHRLFSSCSAMATPRNSRSVSNEIVLYFVTDSIESPVYGATSQTVYLTTSSRRTQQKEVLFVKSSSLIVSLTYNSRRSEITSDATSTYRASKAESFSTFMLSFLETLNTFSYSTDLKPSLSAWSGRFLSSSSLILSCKTLFTSLPSINFSSHSTSFFLVACNSSERLWSCLKWWTQNIIGRRKFVWDLNWMWHTSSVWAVRPKSRRAAVA